MTPNTVWLASYPKSGNTWLRAVYTALVHDAPPDVNSLLGAELPASRRLFDNALGLRSSDLRADEIDRLRPRADELVAAATGNAKWRKIHDALLPGPDGELIVSVEATRCALYLVRDPRDVAVSLAHHLDGSLRAAVESLSSHMAMFGASRGSGGLGVQLRQRLSTWSGHVRSWTEQTLFPVHVVRYEDCTREPVATFMEAFRAAGVNTSRDRLERAIKWASWDALAAQEDEAGFREKQSRQHAFFRRGQAGGWVDELPEELAELVVSEHGDVMAQLGYLA
ncbi:MAG TPA: sulfotransferase domain-containing protein [Acidimicrobiales bacterium]|nr:sulfotransferase domain-containing protein [Acidimicrobiales bacterium]